MPDGTPDAAHREYASRLVEIGARGVGFGLGIQHEHVPQWLIYQCEAVGLPLFTVPLATPFIDISKTIARGISDDTHRNAERMYRNQQRNRQATKRIQARRYVPSTCCGHGCKAAAGPEEAARMAGMHRHTLTKYLGAIDKELSADLNDPGTIAELWYACRFSRFGGTLK